MWPILPSLEPLVQALAPAFTQPSFRTGCQLLLAWVMCLGRHTLRRVGASTHPQGNRIKAACVLFAGDLTESRRCRKMLRRTEPEPGGDGCRTSTPCNNLPPTL